MFTIYTLKALLIDVSYWPFYWHYLNGMTPCRKRRNSHKKITINVEINGAINEFYMLNKIQQTKIKVKS